MNHSRLTIFIARPAVAAFVFVASASAAVQQANFGPARDVNQVVPGIQDAVPLDWDGDGVMDLAAFSLAERNVSLFRGLGAGRFGPKESLFIQDFNATARIASDLDGDGRDDLVVVDTQGKLLWFRSLGGSGAAPPLVLEGALMGPMGLSAQDLEGDGDVDLFCLYRSEASVLVNGGSGVFAAPVPLVQNPISTSPFVSNFCVADFDLDGDLDLVVEGWSTRELIGYENTGPGTYVGAPLGRWTWFGASVLVAEDIDQDGLPDIYVNDGAGAAAWMNTGAFTLGPRQDAAPFQQRAGLFDVDGDGLLDSVQADSMGVTWSRFLGAAGFGPPVLLPSQFSRFAYSIRKADLNGDGRDDLVVAGPPSQMIWMAGGPGGPAPWSMEPAPAIPVPVAAQVIDADGDGDQDILSLSKAGDLYLSRSVGFAVFDRPIRLVLPLQGISGSVLGDFGGNGLPDIAAMHDGNLLSWIESTASGLGAVTQLMDYGSGRVFGPIARDVDGDGLQDLVVGRPDSDLSNGGLSVFHGLTSGGFSPERSLVDVQGWVSSAEAADVDGDGAMDWVVSIEAPNGDLRIDWYRGSGAATLSLGGPILVGGRLEAILDLTQDGLPDVIAATANGGLLSASSTGGGAFAPATFLNFGASLSTYESRILVEDFNRDGLPEIAFAGAVPPGSAGLGISVGWAAVSAQGGLANPESLARIRDAVRPLASGDVDGDGDIDIVWAPRDAGLVSWIPNLASAPIGSGYCGPAPTNSTGRPGTISAMGSMEVTAFDVALRATNLPPFAIGLFLASQTQGFVPTVGGSVGNLCLGGAIGRFVAPGQVNAASFDGALELRLDLAAIPQGNGTVPILAGQTWNFQTWYRDTVQGTATSNFTGGVSVLFN